MKSIKSKAITLAIHLSKYNNSRYPTIESALDVAYIQIKANRYLRHSKKEIIAFLLKKGIDKKLAAEIGDYMKYHNQTSGEKFSELFGKELLDTFIKEGIFCERGREIDNILSSANNWDYYKVLGINFSI